MFRFRLEPVLRYRTWLEEKQQLTAAEKARLYQEAVDRKETLKRQRRAYIETLTEEMEREELQINVIAFYQSYIFRIEREHETQTKRAGEALAALVEEQKKLVEARRAKETMMRAKEKARFAWEEAEAYKDLRMLDDVAGIRFIRERQGLDALASV